MAYTVAIVNQKGGVGKTATTYALGHALAERGRQVLLVDLDPQASLTISVGLEVLDLASSMYEVISTSQHAEGPDEIEQVVRGTVCPTSVERLTILPSTIDLSGAEIELVAGLDRDRTLKRALEPLMDDYDYILIDCPPSLGLLTINALAAATGVIVPVSADFLGLRGAQLLLTKTIRAVQNKLNRSLVVLGILTTRFQTNTTHAHEVLEAIRDEFGELVFEVVVKETTRMKNATVEGESILGFDPRGDVSQAYRALAEEVESRAC